MSFRSTQVPYICSSCSRLLRSSRSSSSKIHSLPHSIKRYASSQQHPFRLAIIGSGPAAFYAASKIMLKHDSSHIDMYEQLPVPFGLVRYGVAPDHPEVKNCQERFEEVASLPNFEFIGNVNVGEDISLPELKRHYDAILFAYGASKDRELGVPGEELDGVMSARAFVGWYNGLPEYACLEPRLERGEEAVVIGQGNVALDVARILLSDVDTLRRTDMPEYALALLSKSKISRVHAVGRRGPMQAAFTIKEVRELVNLPGLSFKPIDRNLFPQDLKSLPRARRRLAELLTKSGTPITSQTAQQKQFSLDFLLSPLQFNSASPNSGELSSIDFQVNEYRDITTLSDPGASVIASQNNSQPIRLDATTAFRSIGYKAEPLPSLDTIGVPFDNQRGYIINNLGRINSPSPPDLGIDVTPTTPGLYVAGWAKRGPTGVIASTMEDAFSTADSILHDLNAGLPFLNHEEGGSTGLGWEGVRKSVEERGIRRTNWKDWERIDGMEREKGKSLGKEREKMTSVGEMLKALDG